MTPTADERFRWPVRVYYEDTDAAGVVYYANFLRYLERARTEWLASLGFTLTALEHEHGVVFVVHRLDIEYRQPARPVRLSLLAHRTAAPAVRCARSDSRD